MNRKAVIILVVIVAVILLVLLIIYAVNLASGRWVGEKYGRDELRKPIGPGHDEAWEHGYISGKLATLRSVLGSQCDFLDT